MDPVTLGAAGIGAAANIYGGQQSAKESDKVARMNIQAQQEFAQHGVEWRAKDARAAEADTGLNALALLGVNTSSFSNVVGNSDAGSGIRAAGQDIARAVAAQSTVQQRQADLEARLTEAKIANLNSDTVHNQAQASDLVKRNAPGTPPGISVPLPRSAPWKIGRAPAFEEFYDRTGGVIIAPSREISSPLQTLGAAPVNAGVALALPGYNIGANAQRDGWNIPEIPLPSVFRDTDNVQGQWFGGM